MAAMDTSRTVLAALSSAKSSRWRAMVRSCSDERQAWASSMRRLTCHVVTSSSETPSMEATSIWRETCRRTAPLDITLSIPGRLPTACSSARLLRWPPLSTSTLETAKTTTAIEMLLPTATPGDVGFLRGLIQYDASKLAAPSWEWKCSPTVAM
eukprot:2805483-Rhodomonas_salina.3